MWPIGTAHPSVDGRLRLCPAGRGCAAAGTPVVGATLWDDVAAGIATERGGLLVGNASPRGWLGQAPLGAAGVVGYTEHESGG